MDLKDYIAAVAPLDEAAMGKARERQAQLAKPPGSLGRLEDLSIQLAGITGKVLNRKEAPSGIRCGQRRGGRGRIQCAPVRDPDADHQLDTAQNRSFYLVQAFWLRNHGV